jgi:hypothetical protein
MTNDAPGGAASAVDEAARRAGLVPVDEPLSADDAEKFSVGARRRRRRGLLDDDLLLATLVQDADGLWEWRTGPSTRVSGRRRSRRGSAASGEVVAQYRFERFGANKIHEFITTRDKGLTPQQGLRRLVRSGSAPAVGSAVSPPEPEWHAGFHDPAGAPAAGRVGAGRRQWWRLEPSIALPPDGRVLLLVHGTFSEGDMYLRELTATAEGEAFLREAWERYGGEIYAFDHPTLSVSPILNAFDLAALMRPSKAQIDLVAHSRGGLVVRWALDVVLPEPDRRYRAVLVASPLDGTTLASPARARELMANLTNLGKTMQSLATSVGGPIGAALGLSGGPLIAGAAIVLQVVTFATGALSRVPLFDAGVSLVPGLAGQSAVQNNPELMRLSALPPRRPQQYAIVSSDFEPSVDEWRFRDLLTKRFWKDRAMDTGADLVFGHDGVRFHNDCVVDTGSMDRLGGLDRAKVLRHDFGSNGKVWHCNYFMQPETLGLIRRHFEWGR